MSKKKGWVVAGLVALVGVLWLILPTGDTTDLLIPVWIKLIGWRWYITIAVVAAVLAIILLWKKIRRWLHG